MRVGATTGVPAGFPTPWGTGGVETGVCPWIGVLIVVGGRDSKIARRGTPGTRSCHTTNFADRFVAEAVLAPECEGRPAGVTGI